ncbi:hypothetical protein [Coralloluteibacterium thermophilus]|uniref:Uncharacterized protein n=1 Tax=Coralloluteibacterium thermophilum TaxID=2707049 RepID=A0ABV9NM27_9GAMM
MRAIGPDRMLGVVSTMGVWAAYFLAIYVLQAIGCEAGWALIGVGGTNLLSVVLALLSVLALGAIGWLSSIGWRAWRQARRDDLGTEMSQRARFMGMTMTLLGVLAAVATVLVAIPVFMLHPCR